MHKLTIDVIDDFLLISSKEFQFSYAPAATTIKKEFQEKYSHCGGLQCGHEEGTEEYTLLEKRLVSFCEQLLYTLQNHSQIMSEGTV